MLYMWKLLLLFNPKHNLCWFNLKSTHSLGSRERGRTRVLNSYLHLPVCSCVIDHRATCWLLQESLLFSEPQFPHLPEPPSSTVNAINNYVAPQGSVPERGQTQTSKDPCGKEEPGGGESQGNPPTETLMAALNIHCCRWVWVWINSPTNECKLRTKQPEENRGRRAEFIGSCAGQELPL